MKKYLAIISVVLMVSGCVSVKYPQRNSYLLKPPVSKHQTRIVNKVLQVNNVAIVPQFGGEEFVYRTSALNYTRDYYNIFFTAPGPQIYQYITHYLQSAKLFEYVAVGVSPVSVNYLLQPKVEAFYADYRNANRPCAVVAINFTLTSVGDKPALLFSKTFRATVLLRHKNSAALVKAWGVGLRRVLHNLSVVMRQKIID